MTDHAISFRKLSVRILLHIFWETCISLAGVAAFPADRQGPARSGRNCSLV